MLEIKNLMIFVWHNLVVLLFRKEMWFQILFAILVSVAINEFFTTI